MGKTPPPGHRRSWSWPGSRLRPCQRPLNNTPPRGRGVPWSQRAIKGLLNGSSSPKLEKHGEETWEKTSSPQKNAKVHQETWENSSGCSSKKWVISHETRHQKLGKFMEIQWIARFYDILWGYTLISMGI